jgi:hypothetical protein
VFLSTGQRCCKIASTSSASSALRVWLRQTFAVVGPPVEFWLQEPWNEDRNHDSKAWADISGSVQKSRAAARPGFCINHFR